MGKLKDNNNAINSIKGKLATIVGLLDDIEEESAVRYIDWIMSKAKLYRDGILKNRYHPLPNKMQRGDIVRCDLGINIPPEFGNDGTGKHFVMIWCQQGHNFIVIPLTKHRPPKENIFTIELGKIDGLPDQTSYAKLDAIRSVSLRRLSKVFGNDDGKVSGKDYIKKINNSLLSLFITNQED